MAISDLLLQRIVSFVPVLLSLTVHEWAHAWTAWKLGDDTAKMLGRVSLNPIDHIDPVGTLLLPLLGVPFGWAKPVPINPVRFRTSVSMPLGVGLIAVAGPISNLLLAAIGCVVLAGLIRFASPQAPHGLDMSSYLALCRFVQAWVLINVVLACFNLLPIPPLDGSRIIDAFMPAPLRPYWNYFSVVSPLVLAAIVLMPSLLGISILALPIRWAGNLLSWVSAR